MCVCVRSPQLILDAQCQATRDAQIQEKKQIQTELVEEEKRLDAMMEVERHQAVETEKQIDELRKQQRIRWRELCWVIHTTSFMVKLEKITNIKKELPTWWHLLVRR